MNQDNPSSQKRQTQDDEIDLGKVFEKIGDFFLNALSVLAKNIKTFTKVFVAGIVLTVILYFVQKPLYVSEMTLSSRFLTNEFCSVLIYNLNELVEEESYNQLQHYLKLPEGQAKSIYKIEYKNLNNRYEELDEDTVLLEIPFKVIVAVKDNEVLDTLGGSIAYYIENNRYAKKREKIEIDNIKNQIEMLAQQRRSLDSLKGIVTSSIAPRESKAGFVYGEPYEPLNIYREEVEFFGKELALRKKLVESESVEVIQDFTKFQKPKRKYSFALCLTIGALASFLIAVMVIVSKQVGKAMKSYEKEKIEQ